MFIRFTARAFRKLLSIYVFSYFPFGFEGRIWDQIVSVPDHCLSFYFINPIFNSGRFNKLYLTFYFPNILSTFPSALMFSKGHFIARTLIQLRERIH